MNGFSNEKETIAMYVHWRDAWDKAFVIMWSDGTWELIQYPGESYYVGRKSYKQFMELNKVVSGKMTKEKAMEFINKKFEELKTIES